MNVAHTPGFGWKLSTPETLTDEAAATITFQATPEQVVLGEYVEVEDAEGIRIGHVQTAVYRERLGYSAYVVVTISLR